MNDDPDVAGENITRVGGEPIDPAPSVASVGAPLPGSGGGMPFVMTNAMKAALRGRGTTDADIERMTPGDAHKLITGADEPGSPLESQPRNTKIPQLWVCLRAQLDVVELGIGHERARPKADF